MDSFDFFFNSARNFETLGQTSLDFLLFTYKFIRNIFVEVPPFLMRSSIATHVHFFLPAKFLVSAHVFIGTGSMSMSLFDTDLQIFVTRFIDFDAEYWGIGNLLGSVFELANARVCYQTSGFFVHCELS